jgi:hypothetical protein
MKKILIVFVAVVMVMTFCSAPAYAFGGIFGNKKDEEDKKIAEQAAAYYCSKVITPDIFQKVEKYIEEKFPNLIMESSSTRWCATLIGFAKKPAYTREYIKKERFSFFHGPPVIQITFDGDILIENKRRDGSFDVVGRWDKL